MEYPGHHLASLQVFLAGQDHTQRPPYPIERIQWFDKVAHEGDELVPNTWHTTSNCPAMAAYLAASNTKHQLVKRDAPGRTVTLEYTDSRGDKPSVSDIFLSELPLPRNSEVLQRPDDANSTREPRNDLSDVPDGINPLVQEYKEMDPSDDQW
jgi:hypothetical protein